VKQVGTSPIKVLIVDDIAETRENLKKLLSFDSGFLVIGEAANGKEAVALTKRLRPDIVLMDINMPVMDGIEATRIITVEAPMSTVVILSVQGEQEYLREAMAAGARNYLVKPFSVDELINTIHKTYDLEIQRRARIMPVIAPQRKLGRIITVFSTKGGVGKTTIATNLAAELAKKPSRSVALVDLDLQFGDIAIMLDFVPVRTIADIAREEEVDSEVVEACLFTNDTGIRVLPSPLRPEQAETVTSRHVEAILRLLAESFDFVIIDLPQGLGDVSLSAMDAADTVLLITSLELPAIKNASICLEIMDALGYEDDKVKLVVNRSSREIGVDISEMEKTLKRRVDTHIPSDGRLVVQSVNKGVPFVMSSPNAKVSLAIRDLAKVVDPQSRMDREEEGGKARESSLSPSRRIASIFAGIFSFFIHG
jgi:pilus assembly protein CpaE